MAAGARRTGGFALLIVLWALVLLSLLFTQLTSIGHGEAQIVVNLRQAAERDAAASGAIFQALYHLLDSGAGHWNADGRVHAWAVPGGEIRAVISNDAGLVNPNAASPELLQALLRGVGSDAATAARTTDAIVGWRSPDAQSAIGPEAYRAAGLGYVPPQSPFQSLDELAQVLGMTPSLLGRLRPHLSVYNITAVDPAFADPIVRQALRDAGETTADATSTRRFPRGVTITVTVSVSGGDVSQRSTIRLGRPGDAAPFKLLTWQTQADGATEHERSGAGAP